MQTTKSPFPHHAKKRKPSDEPDAGPQSLQDIMRAGAPVSDEPDGPGAPSLGGTPMGGPGGPPLAGAMGPNGGGLSPQDMLLAQQLIKKQRIAMLMKAHGQAIKQGSGTNAQGPLSPLDLIKAQFQNQKYPVTLQNQG